MGKWQNQMKTQESLEVSYFPAGDHKTQRSRRDSKDKHETQITKSIHKRGTALEWAIRKLLDGLNMFHRTKLTLNSDVDQYI